MVPLWIISKYINISQVTHKDSMCNASVGNIDLSHITKYFLGNPLKSRAFDFAFQRVSIILLVRTFGVLSMARTSLNNPNVRSELEVEG